MIIKANMELKLNVSAKHLQTNFNQVFTLKKTFSFINLTDLVIPIICV